MKRFFIFISSGIIILVSVYLFAQNQPESSAVIDLSKDDSSKKGIVLGAEDNTPKEDQSVTTINIKIDKNPVNLYWPQKISIQTTPNIEVRVTVTYPNGSINNSGTKSGMSDDKGIFTVGWPVNGKKELLGIAQVNVSVGNLETYSEASSNFEIVEYKKITTPTPTPPPTPTPVLLPTSIIESPDAP